MNLTRRSASSVNQSQLSPRSISHPLHVKHPQQQTHVRRDKYRQSIKWINGLRGILSFLIYWHHHQLWAHSESMALVLELPFGFRKCYYFATFPFIRTFFSGGHLAVSVLFVLSGFTLSAKPLRASLKKDYMTALDVASSAFCRRWLRLYVPFAVMTFLYMSMWYLPVLGHLIRPASALEGWTQEAQRWLREFWSYSYIFSDLSDPWSRYNDHMWTLILELRGSLVVHVVLLVTTRWDSRLRIILLTLLTVYFLLVVDGWYCAMFLCGSLLCGSAIEKEYNSSKKMLQNTRGYRTWFYLALATYLGNVPHVIHDHLKRMPGWYYLSFLKPSAMVDPKWFYLFWASYLLVYVIMQNTTMQRLLEWNVFQYLGSVSFGLYLVHGPLLWTLGEFIYQAIGFQGRQNTVYIREDITVFMNRGPLGLELGFLVSQIILLPVSLLASH
ncbi:hypothetical protein Golomagni_06990, partial [Golovinomyces magnicellulatus]